jgi:anti-sigma factor RsiW
MNCAEFEERILDYLEDTLPEADRHVVDTHLATCAACRRFRNVQEALDARLAGMPSPRLSSGFRQDVRRRIEAARACSSPEWREQQRQRLTLEFEAGRRALWRAMIGRTIPNLLDFLGYAGVLAGVLLIVHHLAGNLHLVPPQSPLACLDNSWVVAALAVAVVGVGWAVASGAEAQAWQWTDWLE